ncbi:uncharacterized protein LOC119314767 [Triticum dicoccoides]|uniref:uncharacterized protein LOC119314767 n=1 Tax=Triticum dicoccoides TaxID=85692 RepID=UPI001891160E|nr:uncharacterized protein LOC119314767 [Triticum dicoccoides]
MPPRPARRRRDCTAHYYPGCPCAQVIPGHPRDGHRSRHTGAVGPCLSGSVGRLTACDVLVGVHGADPTKLLFLRPRRAALLQVAPLGEPHVARGCYEKATAMMEMHYEQYDAAANESSLARKYAADDVVLRDPEAATRERGWGLTTRVYLGSRVLHRGVAMKKSTECT